jgi:hypothetical protein
MLVTINKKALDSDTKLSIDRGLMSGEVNVRIFHSDDSVSTITVSVQDIADAIKALT